jgi:hypothetical protein
MTVTQRRAVIAIDEPTGAGARSDDVLANGQIVYMPTGRGAEVGTVLFVSHGEPLAVPRADGSLTGGELTLADYASLLDP